MNDQPFHLCFLSASRRRESMVQIFAIGYQLLGCVWKPRDEFTLAEKILWRWERFVLCLRNKWSIYLWANDGDWTRAWWIHNPLPWSTWLHPPLPPRTAFSLYLRSDPFWTLPMTAIKDKLFTRVANFLLCFLELGEAKLQQASRSFKQRGWAVHFIDLSPLYLS